MIVSCGRHDCTWELPVLSQVEADRRLTVHLQQRHGQTPLPAVPVLDNARWQQAFLAAVQALPIGWVGTTADLHALVPPPHHHNAWGGATAAAKHVGLLRPVLTQKSELSTTKGSLVHRWERIEPKVRTA